jgi:hypothetical protein
MKCRQQGCDVIMRISYPAVCVELAIETPAGSVVEHFEREITIVRFL